MVFWISPRKIHEHPAFRHSQFTPQKIHGLNAVGTLVYRGNLAVPDELLDRIFLNVAVSAVNLDGLYTDIKTPLGAICFHQGCQQITKPFIKFSFLFVGRQGFLIKALTHIVNKAAHPFHIGFHFQQHPAHIRMPDDRHLGRVGIFALFEVPALNPFAGIVEGVQIGGRRIIKGLKANSQSRFIHHVKHDLHPLAFFSEKQSPAVAFAAQGHGAGRAGVNPHFFLDARANDIICLQPGFRLRRPIFWEPEK